MVQSKCEVPLQVYAGIWRTSQYVLSCSHFVSESKGILEFNLQRDPGTSTQQATALGNLIGEIDCYPR